MLTEPFVYEEGHAHVPQGPGLGVELDSEKVQKYHRLYLERGPTNEFYDPWRPDWVPTLPVF